MTQSTRKQRAWWSAGVALACVLALAATATAAEGPAFRHLATTDTGPGGDVAFWGDLAVLAHGTDDDEPRNDGFRLVDISDPEAPRTVGSFTCPGAAYDVGVWDDLVILSSNVQKTYADCSQREGEKTFAGVHIISISDPARPRQVGSVATNCGRGAHTTTLLPDLAQERLIVYANGLCAQAVVVPLAKPQDAYIGGEMLATTGGCHDVNVHVVRDLAVCANQQQGAEIWDIQNPLRPRQLAHFAVPGSTHHHNAIFSNDGRTLAVGEEALISPFASGCGTRTPVGSIAFYDVSDPTLPRLRSRFQLPRAGTAGGFCTAHQFNVVPLRSDRDVLIAAWYRGGTSAIDFTDPDNPAELAHWQAPSEPVACASPPPADHSSCQNAWSSYWYRDHVFSSNSDLVAGPIQIRSQRGMDILRLKNAGFGKAEKLPYLNAQTQMPLPGDAEAAPPRGRSGELVFGPRRSEPMQPRLQWADRASLCRLY